MAKDKEILLTTDKLKEKEQLDSTLGKNRMKLLKDLTCPECKKTGTITKQVINTAINLPNPITVDDLPLGEYLIYTCSTKNCKWSKKLLINAEM